jgi:hypothetical protein
MSTAAELSRISTSRSNSDTRRAATIGFLVGNLSELLRKREPAAIASW